MRIAIGVNQAVVDQKSMSVKKPLLKDIIAKKPIVCFGIYVEKLMILVT